MTQYMTCLQRCKGAKLRNAPQRMLHIVVAEAPQPALQMQSCVTKPCGRRKQW